jgi:signal transduction histidine kinase
MLVEDNGIGIQNANTVNGTGFKNLNLRAKLIGGVLSISNREINGTKASLVMSL